MHVHSATRYAVLRAVGGGTSQSRPAEKRRLRAQTHSYPHPSTHKTHAHTQSSARKIYLRRVIPREEEVEGGQLGEHRGDGDAFALGHETKGP